MSSFTETKTPTPFGYFDQDPLFQRNADLMVGHVLAKFGDEVASVELTRKQIWACFEEATLEFIENSFLERELTVNNVMTKTTLYTDYISNNRKAKNWTRRYTCALCMEVLGRIRSKIKTVPLPGAELSLDGEFLVTNAREDKEKLLKELKG